MNIICFRDNRDKPKRPSAFVAREAEMADVPTDFTDTTYADHRTALETNGFVVPNSYNSNNRDPSYPRFLTHPDGHTALIMITADGKAVTTLTKVNGTSDQSGSAKEVNTLAQRAVSKMRT